MLQTVNPGFLLSLFNYTDYKSHQFSLQEFPSKSISSYQLFKGIYEFVNKLLGIFLKVTIDDQSIFQVCSPLTETRAV